MSKKLFNDKLTEPISPLIDVVVNALAAVFIILMIYIIVVKPNEDIEPIKFLKNITPPDAIMGQSYLFTFPVTGGVGKRKFSIIEGKLLKGLHFDTDTGTIYGIPAIENKENINKLTKFLLKVQVEDINGERDNVTFLINIHPYAIPYAPEKNPFEIIRKTNILPCARVGESYEAVIGSRGGVEPYEWIIEGKSLPSGISLNNGCIIGTPQKSGLFKIRVGVRHSKNSFVYRNKKYEWSGEIRQDTFELEVLDSLKHKPYLPTGQVGEFYFGMVIMENSIPGDKLKWDIEIPGLSVSEKESVVKGIPKKMGIYNVSYQFIHGEKIIGEGSQKLTILPKRPELTVITVMFHGWVGESLRCAIPYRGFREPVKIEPQQELPEGIKIVQDKIVGIPKKSGLFEIPVEVLDNEKNRASGFIKIWIEPPKTVLKLDVPEKIYIVVDTPFQKKLTAAGDYGEYDFNLEGKLPPNLIFEKNLINGVLTKPGKWVLTVGVRDRISGMQKSKKITIYGVYGESTSPKLQSVSIPNANLGVPYKFSFSGTGGVGNIKFIPKGSLPKGLRFSDSGIVGTPKIIETKSFTVELIDEVAQHAGPYQCKVSVLPSDRSYPQILTKSLPFAICKKEYKHNFAAQGGIGKYLWELSGKLPNGLHFTESGIEGIVKENIKAKWEVEAIVKDEIGQSSENVRLSLFTTFSDETLPQIITKSLPPAIIGKEYECVFAAEGGVGKYSWKLSGNLPYGLHFANSGIKGIVKENNRSKWEIVAMVKDEIGQSSERVKLTLFTTFSDEILPQIVTKSLPPGIIGKKYEYIFAAEGGIGKYFWKLSGKLPTGLQFTSSGIEGVVKENIKGIFEIDAVVKDEVGQTSEKVKLKLFTTFSDETLPQIITKSLPPAIIGKKYECVFAAEGGIGKYTWKISGNLPIGLNFTDSGIEGIVKDTKEGIWIINAVAIDEVGQQSVQRSMLLEVVKVK